MDIFDRTEEADIPSNRMPSERLVAFLKAMWDALVPDSGACVSMQGELVRAKQRLDNEHYRNGMCNYFDCDQSNLSMSESHYGGMMLFILDTMIENRNDALTEEDVAYFVDVRAVIEPQWRRGMRVNTLYDKSEEGTITEEEEAELARIEPLPRGPHWEMFFARAERCIANWCLKNSALVDREGNPVVEGGIRDVNELFEARSERKPSAVCATCGGKGWLPPKNAGDFPATCRCKLN